MAVFMIRMVAAAGVTLPSGVSQGFTDIGGLTAAQQTAVNQMKQLGITSGTSVTTYSPFLPVPRWQMALFIAAALNVMGVVPSGIGTFTVSPSTSAGLTIAAPEGTSDDRSYTVSNTIAGATHTIQLYPAANVTVSGNTATFADSAPNNGVADPGAPVATFTLVNGAAAAGTMVTAIPVSGVISFTIDSNAAGSVIPVVYVNSTADGGLTLNSSDQPVESFGVGGVTTWTPAEAAGGAFGGAVTIVDKSGDAFVIAATYFYDSNDSFQIGGVPTTMANFESNLSSGDSVTGSYADSAAAVSTFNLTDSNPSTPILNAPSQSGTAVNLTFVPVGDWDSILIQRALSANNTNCATTVNYNTINTFTAQGGPFSYSDATAPLGEELCYRLIAVNDGDESTPTAGQFITTTTAGTAPTIVEAYIVSEDAGLLVGQADNGDVWEFVFSEAMAPGSTTGTVQLSDGNGTIFNVTLAGGVLDDTTDGGTIHPDNRVLTFTISAVTRVGSSGDAIMTYPATVSAVPASWDDVGGAGVNLAASADKVVS
jgi:hypothetical protein